MPDSAVTADIAPLWRYCGGHKSIMGTERQSAITPCMTRLAILASQEQDQRVKLCLDLLQLVDTSEGGFTVFDLGRSCPRLP